MPAENPPQKTMRSAWNARPHRVRHHRPAVVAPAPKTKPEAEPMPDESRKAFLLRINPDLWKELESWAQTELRSVNGQIEYLLRQAVSQRRTAKPKNDE